MQNAHRFFSAVALALLSASNFASTVTYTSSAVFLANVAPGAYTETFTGLDPLPAGAIAFNGGGFSYQVAASQDLFSLGAFVETSQINEALTITFTSGNVTAVGGNFFAVDLNDDFQSVSLTLTLNDGTTETFTPNSLADSYRGFISDAAFTSLVISAPGTSLYAGFDNLTVGVPAPTGVPEPTSWALVGLALAGLLVTRRRTA